MFELNYKSMFKNMKQFTVYAVILAAVLTVPMADVFGFENKPNDFSKREKLTVSVLGKKLTFNEQ